MFHSRFSVALPLGAVVLTGLGALPSCVSYEADDATPQSVAAVVDARPGGRFTVAEALALALRQHPELRALAARLRAAEAERTVPLPFAGELRGRNESIGLMVDPVALLGLGPRGGAIERQDAAWLEAAEQLAVARWRVAAEVVEAFAIDRALAELDVPDWSFDVDAFAAAGLAAAADVARLQAAVALAGRERAELERERADNASRLRHLLGLSAAAELVLEHEDTAASDNVLQQPAGTLQDLLHRPDLALAAARFELADAEFRLAVQEQYPRLQIGPNVSLRGDPLRAMGMLQLPVLTGGRAVAARERRLAARADLEDALLEARSEAEQRDQALQVAVAALAASAAESRASAESMRAASAAVDVEVDAFGMLARAASERMRAVAQHRQAVLQHERAQVWRASAYGWPVQPHAADEQEVR